MKKSRDPHPSPLGEWAPEVIEVTAPGGRTVHLRYPTFAEWHELASAHQALEGKPAPASVVARTLIVCVANADGSPAFDAANAAAIMQANPHQVMWLYNHCLRTVLKHDNDEVSEVEKNSAAGQD